MFRPESHYPGSDEPALHIVFQRGKLVSDPRSPEACILDEAVLQRGQWQVQRRQFIGYWHDRPCFAVEIDAGDRIDEADFQRGNLYQLLGRVDDQLFTMAGRAAQLLDWERDHQFCGRCGAPMQVDSVERAMRCDPCGTSHFPKIAPCIIVLVTRGEHLLLARNAGFPGAMYSTLAGFIEPGESAEETLVREVREEVGVEVDHLRYFQSQAWPFPNQLMLGFFAEYAGGDIVPDGVEIADADWFHYTDPPKIPPPSSVAGQLIRHYVQSLSS